ncbi:dioxygenase family protein [Frateuria defendens]|uniref:dioxygenase family protein n=1 Tax=Frateuria defendens TaxID=2219559 RepID=UPI00066FEEA0|nr:class III extradiol ring-cleavage dioxygenase [Frateuria defendens]
MDSTAAAPSTAPVLFVSHGAPTFALDPGELGPRLAALGRRLDGLRAVLVVSPHWSTRGVKVMTAQVPSTVHDFGGFPEPLYALQYPAPGAPELAREAAALLAEAGFAVTPDAARGRDHGAWVPLLHLLPAARVPVFQVSLPHDLDTAGALRLGRALAPLRGRGVLIVGSGSLTHNLYEIGAHSEAPYARDFTRWVREAVLAHDALRLRDYRHLAPAAERAHPTEEHFLPLLVALGASRDGEAAEVIEGGITYGVLSMESYGWGLPGAAAPSR